MMSTPIRLLCCFFIALQFSSCDSAQSELVASSSLRVDEGRVVGIKDGDTFKVLQDGKEITVRLSHIDCPEKGQPFGQKAKQFASDLCFGKNVRIVISPGRDRYKRVLAELYVDSVCVNEELVRNGYAWHFKKHSKSEIYAALEMEARKSRKGLWSEKDASPPWDWRKK